MAFVEKSREKCKKFGVKIFKNWFKLCVCVWYLDFDELNSDRKAYRERIHQLSKCHMQNNWNEVEKANFQRYYYYADSAVAAAK